MQRLIINGKLTADKKLISFENQTVYQITGVIEISNYTIYCGEVYLPPATLTGSFFNTSFPVIIVKFSQGIKVDHEEVEESLKNKGIIQYYSEGIIKKSLIEHISIDDGMMYAVYFHSEKLPIMDTATLEGKQDLAKMTVHNPHGGVEFELCLRSVKGNMVFVLKHVILKSDIETVYQGSIVYQAVPDSTNLYTGTVKVLILETNKYLSQEQIIEFMLRIGYSRYKSCYFEQIECEGKIYVVMPYILGGEKVPLPQPIIHEGEVQWQTVYNEWNDAYQSVCISTQSGCVYEIYNNIRENGSMHTYVYDGGILVKRGDGTLLRRMNVTKVAVKMFLTGSFPENGLHEVAVMQHNLLMDCPFRSRMIECIKTEKATFLIMPFAARGGNMIDKINVEGVLANDKTLLSYFIPILKATNYLKQQSFTHRGICAEHILLGSREEEKCQLCDFSQTIQVPKSPCFEMHLDISWELFGKERYLPPEIFFQQLAPYDPYRSEMWQLGILLFYMASGNHLLDKNIMDPMLRYQYTISQGRIEEFARENGFILSGLLLYVISLMLSTDPLQRPSCEDLLTYLIPFSL